MYDLGIILPYFNFFNEKSIYNNFIRCINNLKTNNNIAILVAEALLPNCNSQLSYQSEDFYILIEAQTILWYKESLINYSIKRLTDICQNIAWFDSDILFVKDDWTDQIYKSLEHYKIVQCFGDITNHFSDSTIPSLSALKHLKLFHNHSLANTGGAWAARSDTLRSLSSPLFPYCIVGGADHLFYSAILHKEPLDIYSPYNPFYPKYRDELQNIIKEHEVGYVDQPIITFPHGKIENRQYHKRQTILTKYNLEKDLSLVNGFIQIDNPLLKEEVKDYFLNRKCDQ